MLALIVSLASFTSSFDELAADPLVYRSYDVSSITRKDAPATNGMHAIVLHSPHNEYDFESPEKSPIVEVEQLIDLIRTCYPDENWDNSWRLDVVGNGIVDVWASEEAQKNVGKFLTWMQGSLTNSPVLHINAYQTSNPRDVSLSSSLITINDADNFLDQMMTKGVAKHLRGTSQRLNANRGGHTQHGDVRNIVFGWGSDVANSAAASTPAISELILGLEAMFHASPTIDGTSIDFVVRQSNLLGIKTRSLRTPARITKDGVYDVPHVGSLETPRMSCVTVGSSAVLAPGQALWIPIHLQTALGTVSYLLDIRTEGAAWNQQESLDLGNNRTISMSSLRGLMGTRVGLGEVFPLSGLYCHRELHELDQPASVFSLTRFGATREADRITTMLEMIVPDFFDGEHTTMTTFSEQTVTTVLPEDASKRVRSFLSSMSRQPSMRVLSGRVLGDGDSVIGSFELPLQTGKPAILWAGVQSTMIRDWYVEIAQDASCSGPEMRTFLDGLVLKAVVSETSEGQYSISIDGSCNLLREEPTEIALETQDARVVDRIHATSFEIQDQYQTGLGTKQRWGSGSLSLELTLK